MMTTQSGTHPNPADALNKLLADRFRMGYQAACVEFADTSLETLKLALEIRQSADICLEALKLALEQLESALNENAALLAALKESNQTPPGA